MLAWQFGRTKTEKKDAKMWIYKIVVMPVMTYTGATQPEATFL